MPEGVSAEADAVPEKEPLITEDGRPTKEGWRKIGERFRTIMPTRQRKGPGGRQFDYITARQVQDRLDAVVGPGNWQSTFRVLDVQERVVECTLMIFGVCKSDVGCPNNPEKPELEAFKSSYSDALKRAAVHWGIGRFLYEDDD